MQVQSCFTAALYLCSTWQPLVGEILFLLGLVQSPVSSRNYCSGTMTQQVWCNLGILG